MDTTGQYFSEKRESFIYIKDMPDQHLQNAITNIQRGTHSQYGPRGAKISELLTEQVTRLKRRLSVIEKVNKARLTGRQEVPQSRRKTLLALSREIALSLIGLHGHVSADMVRSNLEQQGINVPGSIMSHIFKSRQFSRIGFRRSEDKAACGRYVNVWTKATN